MAGLSRRGFLQGLGAAATIPAMPALPVAAAPATFTKAQFVWVTAYAQMNNACTPAQIVQSLGVKPRVAQKLYAEMLRRGVLVAQVGGGAARPAKASYRAINGHRPARVLRPIHKGTRGPYRLEAARIMRAVTRDIHWQLPFRPDRAPNSPLARR